jgi:hypothetical protein
MVADGIVVAGCWAPFAAAAAARARVLGDELGPAGPVVVLALAAVASALAADRHASVDVALAYLAVCAWTDVRARRVYLPVSGLAGVAVAIAAIADGGLLGHLVGAASCAAFALLLHLGTRRRGFGCGDVAAWTVLGAGCGPYDAFAAIAVGAGAGAAVYGTLVARGVLPRSYPVPLAALTFLGIVVVRVCPVGWMA